MTEAPGFMITLNTIWKGNPGPTAVTASTYDALNVSHNPSLMKSSAEFEARCNSSNTVGIAQCSEKETSRIRHHDPFTPGQMRISTRVL
jgi:hypothetical protein